MFLLNISVSGLLVFIILYSKIKKIKSFDEFSVSPKSHVNLLHAIPPLTCWRLSNIKAPRDHFEKNIVNFASILSMGNYTSMER